MANLFDQKIQLVELTKLLERDTCDTLTFTYPMGHNFTAGAAWLAFVEEHYKITINGDKEILKENAHTLWNDSMANSFYDSPIPKNNKIMIMPIQCYVEDVHIFNQKTTLSVVEPGGNLVELGYVLGNVNTLPQYYQNTLIGDYQFIYEAQTVHAAIQEKTKIIYNFSSVSDIEPKTIPSITDVVERILSVGLVRKENEPQKYRLDPAFAEKYKELQAPEFHITRCTLYEALLQVGGYIHAIPRLDWDEEVDDAVIIAFDELGGSSEYIPPEDLNIIGYQCETNADEYCGTLDSYVDNIVNTVNPHQGSITEPSEDGYKTMRTEEGGIVIEDNSIVFATEFPIYRITSLAIGFLKDGKLIGSMLPYVYEQAEYDALTGYDGAYPYAKKFAVCFKQGDNKITGITLKALAQTALGTSFEDYAIRNIAERITNIVGVAKDTAICDMAFRITYMPIISARVKQRKPYKTHPFDNTLFYQQGANTIESDYYGEHLKGQIAKIGNQVEVFTCRFRLLTDLPKIGQRWNDKYICQIDKEFERHYVKASIYVTPNFNRLSQYIGINSNFRLYDVSEKQSVKRDINYSENIYIGDVEDNNTSLTAEGIKAFVAEFDNSTHSDVGIAVVQGRSKDNSPIQVPTIHSCVSMAMGNALTFVWKFEDNYSAGKQASYLASAKKLQKLVPYGDNFGELYKLGFVLKSKLNKTFTFADQQSSSSSQGFCDRLPVVDSSYLGGSDVLIDFNTVPLIVQKDSREALEVTTQLHMVASRQSIVLGHELTHKNPLVSGTNNSADKRVVFLPYKLNMLQAIVDLNGAYTVIDGADVASIISSSGRKMTIGRVQNSTENTYKSWAIINPQNKKLYIGENMNLTPGTSTEEIVFNF